MTQRKNLHPKSKFRICKGPCGLSLLPTEENFFFRKSARNGVPYPSSYCKNCEREKSAKKRRDSYATPEGKLIIDSQNLQYRSQEGVAERLSEKARDRYASDEVFRELRRMQILSWQRTNSGKRSATSAIYFQKTKAIVNVRRSQREKDDPAFRLRNRFRIGIWAALRYWGGNKGGRSILKHLPYTMVELRDHISSLWEPWMTWENWGPLEKGRRTWQIDHVVPQAKLPFKDFSDPNFLACWSLTNLRPLESSLNVSKGCR